MTYDEKETCWHLICITRKGKVSMLKNLDLRSAREAYKRLQPDTRPKKHDWCEQCYGDGQSLSWGCSYGGYSSSDSDRLEKVETIGPEGVDLDPWHGVKPKRVFHCDVGRPRHNSRGEYIGSVPPHPKPEPNWKEGRSDFWNNPKLWDGIDPITQMCWRKQSDELLHSNGTDNGSSQPNEHRASDLRRPKRAKGISAKHAARGTPKAASKRNSLNDNAALQSERAGA